MHKFGYKYVIQGGAKLRGLRVVEEKCPEVNISGKDTSRIRSFSNEVDLLDVFWDSN